jgi:glutaminase
MFAGAERVARVVDRQTDDFDVTILDVTRIDTINDSARALLAGMSAALREAGKQGLVVDPDWIVIRPDRGYDDIVFTTVDDARASAESIVRANPIR